MSSQTGNTESTGEHSLCDGLEGAYSMPLHVAAIFIVFGATLLGTAMPLISKCIPFLRRNHFLFVIAKTAATGVLLSVSTVHLIGAAAEAMREPCVPQALTDFYEPYPFFLVAVAALIMHAVDFEVNHIAMRWLKRQQRQRATEETEAAATARDYGTLKQDGGEAHDDQEEECLPACAHSHGGVLPPTTMGQLRRVIAAVSMEFGVTLHSIFIGLDMGLTTDDNLKPLLVALVFHQLFEGMALGSRLVDAKLSLLLNITFVAMFCLSAPLGMSISAIAVSIRKDAMAGGWFALLMGTLSGFCGGILLYLTFSLLFSDFAIEMKAHCSDGMPKRLAKKFAMFVSLWLGMLVMSLLGKWL